MNKNIILIALLCLLSIDRVGAQSVTVEAKIDSLQILIGEQAKIQLQVAMDAKQRAVFPAYTDTSGTRGRNYRNCQAGYSVLERSSAYDDYSRVYCYFF